MEYFNKGLFVGAFTFVAGVLITVTLAIIVGRGDIAIDNVVIVAIVVLLASAVIAVLIAAYRVYPRGCVWIYRAVMRRLATRALRALNSALSQVSQTRFECSGISEIQGAVALRILAGRTQGIQSGDKFNLYEATGDACWGSVVAIDVRESYCDCRLHDRKNEKFWETLEDRMMYDTSKPPNVYLTLDTDDYETTINLIIELLHYYWR